MDKQKLLHACKTHIENKLTDIQKAIDHYQLDLNSETKSSAGDKHETGRAMLQLEMEKLGQQYQNVWAQKNKLNKIDIEPKTIAQAGSLISTNNNLYYFLAESIGRLAFEQQQIMVISTQSPIGQLLIGKKEEDQISFNQQKITIKHIY